MTLARVFFVVDAVSRTCAEFYVAGCVSSVRLVYDGFHLKPLTCCIFEASVARKTCQMSRTLQRTLQRTPQRTLIGQMKFTQTSQRTLQRTLIGQIKLTQTPQRTLQRTLIGQFL